MADEFNFTDFLKGTAPLLGLLGGGAALANAYDRLGGIGEAAQQGAMQIAQQGLTQSQFQPFTVTSTTGSRFGYDPTTGAVSMGLSPAEQQLQNRMMGQASLFAGQPPAGAAGLTQAGQQTLARGQSLLGQGAFGRGLAEQASRRAYGLGEQFMGAAQAQPADINLLRGQFAGQVGALLGQQPSAGIGQFGQQALGMGAAGLGTQAPADVEALRRQYAGLAGQAAGDVLAPMAGREADVYERIRATQRPEEERQRLALEERLAQQGRLGVRTAMFGGTPEQLAMSQAQEEAQNRASLAAIQQAQAEQQQALGTAQALGGMFAGQAGLSSQLQSAAQQRAAQLSQLGLSAQQIESQLQSEGLGRAATSAQQAAQLAQLAGGLQAQQAALGAQYTGMGADLASQRQALAQAGQSQALQAMQAGQGLLGGGLGLQQAQQQLAQGALAGSYLPQAQLLNVQQAAQLYPQLQQRGQLYGAGLFGEAAMGGLEALLGAGLGQANLMGQLGTGLIGGLATPTDSYGGLGDVIGTGVEALFGEGGLFSGLGIGG